MRRSQVSGVAHVRRQLRHRPLPPRLLYLAALVGGLSALGLGWYTLGGTADSAGGSRYVEGVVGQPRLPNPLLAEPDSVDADLVALLFSGLTRIEGDGTAQPDIAEHWDVTPDGLTYTFHLRPDVYWHDGQRVSAADVAFTIALVQAEGFDGPPGLAAQWAGATVSVIDAETLEVRLPAPSASFLTRASLGILPEHLLGSLAPGELRAAPFNRSPVGAGPYRLVRVDAASVLLERHPGYHLGIPALELFELRLFRDEESLLAALGRGDIDGALLAEDATAARREQAAAQPGVAITELPSSGYTALYMNNQRDPLNDPQLRRALAAAIDRGALLASMDLAARGRVGDGPVVPGSWAHAAAEWPSPAEADELFEAAAWTPGEDGVLQRAGQRLELELVTNASPARQALAEAVAEQLRARGVHVVVAVLPSAELVTRRLAPRDYELAIFGWETEVDPDPYGAWHTSQIVPPGANVSGYHDPLADALLEAARQTLDVAERRELYQRFTERFVETAPSLVLHYPARLYAHPARLEELDEGLLFQAASRFRDVHLWRLADAD